MKSKTKLRIIVLSSAITFLIGCILMISLCTYYKDFQYNTLTCEIFGVTDVESIYKNNAIKWFFQYNYRAENCSNYDTYTIYGSDYEEAISNWDYFSNLTTATCYAKKTADQCNVSMKITKWNDYLLGVLFGSIGIFLSLILICVKIWQLCGGDCNN